MQPGEAENALQKGQKKVEKCISSQFFGPDRFYPHHRKVEKKVNKKQVRNNPLMGANIPVGERVW